MDHLDIGKVMNNLPITYTKIVRHPNALKLHEKTIAIINFVQQKDR